MNAKRILTNLTMLIVLLSAFLVVGCEKEEITEDTSTVSQEQEITQDVGERIINAYIDDNLDKLDPQVAKKGSKGYLDFLFGVDMGDYPDLTGDKSKYIKSSEELGAVLNFAFDEFAHLYDLEDSEYIPELKSVGNDKNDKNEINSSTKSSSYNRLSAKNYAFNNAIPSNVSYSYGYYIYPYFPKNCTNFISQAVKYGGISMVGSGDGCENENNSNEWYIESTPNTGCNGNWGDWEWSNSWTSTTQFRNYHQMSGNAVVLGTTKSAYDADYYLDIGDIIQIEKWNGSSWQSYHTMMVTIDYYNNLNVSYQSANTKYKTLSSIPLIDKRLVLIRMN